MSYDGGVFCFGRSSISSNSFTAETPSVGDEAEDSESESGLTVPFSKDSDFRGRKPVESRKFYDLYK